MSQVLTLTGSFATVWLATWLLCCLLLLAVYPLLRRRLLAAHPALASNLLLLLLAFPFILSLLSTLLLFSPALENNLVSEHCHENCQAHVPLVEIPGLAELGLLMIAVIMALLLGKLIYNLRTARRLMAQLSACATRSGEFELLADDTPFVFTLGWWRNRIFMTRGLLERCNDDDVAIILAHENAHARRKDNLRLLSARLFLLVLPGFVAQRFYEDLHKTTESACDFEAAKSHSGVDVADALLKIHKLVPSHAAYGDATISSAFTGAEVEYRIRALLDDRRLGRLQRYFAQACALALLVLSTLLVDPLHHSVELLLHVH